MSDMQTAVVERTAAELPYARFKATRRFGSLDGWRAFAIVAVIWQHTMARSFASPIAQEGRHGVGLFFVISGFLIVTLLLREKESPKGFSLSRFWVRRALRILPIYYGVLAVYIVLVWYMERSPAGAEFFDNLPSFATFTTNWFADTSDRTIFFFSWSLAAEEQFYLVWPLVEVLVCRPLLKFALLGVVMVTSQIALAAYGFKGEGPLGMRILYNVPLAIMLGTALAHAVNTKGGFRIVYLILGRRGSAFGALAFTIATAFVSPSIGFAGEIMVSVAFLLLVGSTVIREDNDMAAFLRWKPVVWIGTVSYGMYMLHMLSVNVIRKATLALSLDSPVVEFIGGTALACGVASLSFLYYERKFLMLKDRFLKG
jgi:peptidoglycan/LPS O-acetylase OafA/YrhL